MEDPILELQSGRIRGVVENHEDGFDYYAFRGIPYAEQPVGELRFEDPVPKKSWQDVLDCKNYGPMCLQHNCFYNHDSYEEDCLHLSVFTRSIDGKNEKNVPVIFVIHGGAFIIGSSDDYNHGPEYLMRKNVVLVMVQYRLGVLGFLNLEDEIVAGNQGLKDILMGLQWVQDNIRRFGGDPDNVTLLGLAAGGVAAHYLGLSPAAKGLCHKVISQGAVIYTTWSVVKNSKSIAIRLCSLLGKNLTDSAEILRFLKTVDCEALHDAQESLRREMVFTHSFPFGPGRDDKSPNPIMPMDPMLAADQGVQLPYLVGCNTHEGIALLTGISRREFFEMCDKDFQSIMLYNLSDVLAKYGLNDEQVRRMYYGDEVISDQNVDNYVRLISDFHGLEPIHKFARVQVEKSSAPTYLFIFGYETPKSVSKILVQNAPRGCGHLDDVPYLFKPHAFEKVGIGYFEKGDKDYQLMERMTEMWTNFARYGNPTVDTSDLTPVEWTPVTDGKILRYLDINDDITMQSTVNIEQKLLTAKCS